MEPEVEPKNVLATKLLARVIYVMTKNKAGYQCTVLFKMTTKYKEQISFATRILENHTHSDKG